MKRRIVSLVVVALAIGATAVSVSAQPVTPPGLRVVTHDSTLTGSGTIASPLGLDAAYTPTGLTNRLAVFTATHQLGSSAVVDDGTGVTIGVATALATPLSLTATSNQSLVLTRYGGSAGIVLRAALGTEGAPTALPANGFLGGLRGGGYHSGGAFSTPQTWLIAASAENWTSTAQGTYLLAYTTPIGGTGAINRLKIDSAGNMGIGGYDTLPVGHKLEVNGTGEFTGALTEASNRVFSIAGVGLTSTGATVDVGCGTGITCAANAISVDTSGFLTGTQNFLAKFDATGHNIGNSTISDDASGTVTETFSGGPTLSIDDTSTSAAPKTIARELFRAKDASGTLRTQAQITVDQNDKTNSSNDGRIQAYVVNNGSMVSVMNASSDPATGYINTDFGNSSCVASSSVHCGEMFLHADDVDIGGTVTIGKIDGSGTNTLYGALQVGIANGAIPAADANFGKNVTVNGKTFLVGASGVDINGQLYTYADPLLSSGVTVGDNVADASDWNGTVTYNGTAGSNGNVLTIVGGLPKWGAETGDIAGVTTADILTGGCTSGTCALSTSIATASILGRTTAGTGATEQLTGTQATAVLDLATTSLKGLAPARSGTATTYLDGTGAYSTPAGTNPISGLTTNTIPKATSSTAIGNSTITDNGTSVVLNGSSGVTVTTSSATIGGASGISIDSSNVDAIGGTLQIQRNHPTGTVNIGNSSFSLSAINLYGPATVKNTLTVGSAFTNPSTLTSTNATINAGGATGVLNVGTAATGGVNIGSATNAIAAAGDTTFARKVTTNGGKLTDTGTPPSVTGCGTSPTVTGGSWAFNIHVGTGTTTTCDVTGLTFTSSAPTCQITGSKRGRFYISVLSATAMTIANEAATNLASDDIYVTCVDH